MRREEREEEENRRRGTMRTQGCGGDDGMEGGWRVKRRERRVKKLFRSILAAALRLLLRLLSLLGGSGRSHEMCLSNVHVTADGTSEHPTSSTLPIALPSCSPSCPPPLPPPDGVYTRSDAAGRQPHTGLCGPVCQMRPRFLLFPSAVCVQGRGPCPEHAACPASAYVS